MPHPFPQRFAVLDGGLERALDAWDPPRLGGTAALLTPRGPVDGRLLLFERFLEFRPSTHGSRTRVVVELDEIVNVQRELVFIARLKPFAFALRIVVPEHREVRLLVERPQAWIDAVRLALEAMPTERPPLSSVPAPG